jgi:osmotically-inducible protein OsmY
MIPFLSGAPDEPLDLRPTRRLSPVLSDDRIASRVVLLLVATLLGRRHRISVRVQNGVVIVDGVVPSEDVRRLVHRVVWSVRAVRDVSDRLELGAGR